MKKNEKTNKAEVKNDETNKQGKDEVTMKTTEQVKTEEKIIHEGITYSFNPDKDSFEFIKANNNIFKGDAETGLKIHKALIEQSKLAVFNDKTPVEKIAEFLKYDALQLSPMRYEGKLKISDSKGEQVYKFIMSQGEKLKAILVKIDKSIEINRARLEREKGEYRKRATRLHNKKNDTFTLLKTILPLEEYLKLKGAETTSDRVETTSDRVETTSDRVETTSDIPSIPLAFEELLNIAKNARSRRNTFVLMLTCAKGRDVKIDTFNMIKAFQLASKFGSIYNFANQTKAIETICNDKDVKFDTQNLVQNCRIDKGKYVNIITGEVIS